MNTNRTNIDITNLSSRKLWQLLTGNELRPLEPQMRILVVEELRARSHYIAELNKLQQKTLH